MSRGPSRHPGLLVAPPWWRPDNCYGGRPFSKSSTRFSLSRNLLVEPPTTIGVRGGSSLRVLPQQLHEPRTNCHAPVALARFSNPRPGLLFGSVLGAGLQVFGVWQAGVGVTPMREQLPSGILLFLALVLFLGAMIVFFSGARGSAPRLRCSE